MEKVKEKKVPSSAWQHVSSVIDVIYQLQPTSVLDVGIGYGKWAFLCREYLESWNNRVFPEQWQVRIDGIEIFAPYCNLPWISHLYNQIYIGDARLVVNELQSRYDVIMAGDVIEHIEKEAGIELLKRLVALTNKALILSIPIGEAWLGNKVAAGNPAEKHRASWEIDEVHHAVNPNGELAATAITFDVLRGPSTLFVFKK